MIQKTNSDSRKEGNGYINLVSAVFKIVAHVGRSKKSQSNEGMKIKFCRDLLFHSVFMVVIVMEELQKI